MAAANCDMSSDPGHETEAMQNELLGLSLNAHDAFQRGDVKAAQAMMIQCFDKKAFLDENYHHQLFLNTGDNHQLIHRNNLAIVKETTLRPGAAEVLFRVSLDQGLKYTETNLSNEVPSVLMKKLINEMDIVRCNLGLSWLANPSHSQSSFAAIVYSLRCFPSNSRLWVHAAEACFTYLCSQYQELLFQNPLPKDYDLIIQTNNDPSRQVNELNMMKTYIPQLNGTDEAQPSFEFAENCLEQARRLIRTKNRRNSLNGCPLEFATLSETEAHISMLTNSAFVALRLKNFQQALDFTDKLWTFKDVPLKYKFVAMCCQDVALFHLTDADWSVFKPISFEDHIGHFKSNSVSEKFLRDYLSKINVKRKYLEIFACLLYPMNLKFAAARLEEYLKDNVERLPRAMVTLYMFLSYKSSSTDTTQQVQAKLRNLHKMLMAVSPAYRREYNKKRPSTPIEHPPNKSIQIIRNLQTELRKLPSDTQPQTSNQSNSTRQLIKISQRGGRPIRIPL